MKPTNTTPATVPANIIDAKATMEATIAAREEAQRKQREYQAKAAEVSEQWKEAPARKDFERVPIIPRHLADGEALLASARAVISMKATAAERRTLHGLDPAQNPWRIHREDLVQQAALYIMEAVHRDREQRKEAAREAMEKAIAAARKAGTPREQWREIATKAGQEAARKPSEMVQKYGSIEGAVFAYIGAYVYRTYERDNTIVIRKKTENGETREILPRRVLMEHVAETVPAAPFERRIIDRMTAETTRAALEEYAREIDGKTRRGTYQADMILQRKMDENAGRMDISRARADIMKAFPDVLAKDTTGHRCII